MRRGARDPTRGSRAAGPCTREHERHRMSRVEREGTRADADRPARDLRLVARLERAQQEAERGCDRRDERHVGERLMREQRVARHREEDDGADEPGAPPARARDAVVEDVRPDDREHERGHAHRPLGMRRGRRRAGEDLVGAGAHAEHDHRERLEPEHEDGLRHEPALVRPPRRDEIAALDHLARHLRVVGLPRIHERDAPSIGRPETMPSATTQKPWRRASGRASPRSSEASGPSATPARKTAATRASAVSGARSATAHVGSSGANREAEHDEHEQARSRADRGEGLGERTGTDLTRRSERGSSDLQGAGGDAVVAVVRAGRDAHAAIVLAGKDARRPSTSGSCRRGSARGASRRSRRRRRRPARQSAMG